MGTPPTQDEVLGYFDSLSNWGRWGGDDLLGTLNLITPEKRTQAASLVREGVSVSCSRQIPYPGPMAMGAANPLINMVQTGERYALGDNPGQPALPRRRDARVGPPSTSRSSSTAWSSRTSTGSRTSSTRARCTTAAPPGWSRPPRAPPSRPRT